MEQIEMSPYPVDRFLCSGSYSVLLLFATAAGTVPLVRIEDGGQSVEGE